MDQSWKTAVKNARTAKQAKEPSKPEEQPEQSAADTSKKKAKAVAIDPRMVSGMPNVYFDCSKKGKFWRLSDKGEWISYSVDEFTRYLKTCGFNANKGKEQTCSEVERILVSIHHNRRVDFAGPLAGYRQGIYKMLGARVLINRGPELIQPVKGEWSLFKKMLEEMFGDDAVYFYGWTKAALEALRAGPPFRPGQVLIIAGSAGSGKSLLQNIITDLLGGRPCKPFKFLIGKTDFNGNCMGAEHWMLEDEVSKTGHSARREFAAALKNAICNEVQRWAPKGVDDSWVTPFIRLTITLNDNPESLLVLPPIDEDVEDKLMLLHASPIQCNKGYASLDGRKRFKAKLLRELPGFLHAMEHWTIPETLQDIRYGIKAYRDADLEREVDALSPEVRLLEIIDAMHPWTEKLPEWTGTAFDMESKVKAWDRNGEARDLIRNSKACGTYLSRLTRKMPDRVRIHRVEEKTNLYKILKPAERKPH